MRCSPVPRRKGATLAIILTALFGASILLSIIIPTQICLASGEETNLSTDAAPSNLTDGNTSAKEGIPVHVYITNNDNEKLDVSLFIDSELIDRKSISSGADQKIDSYPLEKGSHTFKISWWDEDVKSSFEVEEIKDITAETSVNLYTTLNEEPEEFEITVNLVNENSRELEAFLYADGSFEKSKKVGKESSAELGKINLKEGIHNLSVRWQDDDTRIEYEKTKKLMVKRDEVVIFYAPKGVSFEAKNASSGADDRSSGDSDKKTSIKDEQIDKEDPVDEPDAGSENASKTDSTSAEVDDEKKGAKGDVIETKDEASSRYGIGSSASTDNPLQDSSGGKSSPAKNANSMIGGSLEDGNRLYIYAALIMLTIYLLLRH
ncbi:MAG TPA: hypothetical protein PLV49_05845 [Methanothrix soehngenii]|nr:hypothetical protein [Methanothrix soehngenii]